MMWQRRDSLTGYTYHECNAAMVMANADNASSLFEVAIELRISQFTRSRHSFFLVFIVCKYTSKHDCELLCVRVIWQRKV